MIEVKHNGYEIIDVSENGRSINLIGLNKNQALIKQLYVVAAQYQDKVILWFHESLQTNINRAYILNNFKDYMMWSFSSNNYLGHRIGYVEDSPFINVNKSVKYPTWLMGSECGAIHSKNLLKFKDTVDDNSLDFALNAIAKLGMAVGLWCYSVPQILLGDLNKKYESANTFDLYRFIAYHYKKTWIFLLFINLLIYEKRFSLLGLFYAIALKRRAIDFSIEPAATNQVNGDKNPTIDIVIPTMGRKQFLFDFLQDLKMQSLLPVNIIIVEQNPEKPSNSELDYLYNQPWPFKIVHKFIHKTGACNARNIALDLVTSNYIFFADDDIRIEDKSLLKDALRMLRNLDTNVINLACLQLNEVDQTKNIKQWAAFGSGCSMVSASVVKDLRFNMAFEHGYGEDVDFGMQLRYNGEDIIYVPQLKLLHLKAPIGGFRDTNLESDTENIELLPKPSPTVMLFRMKHTTVEQLYGYRTILCIKYYRSQSKKNPITYIMHFNKKWKASKAYAINLIKNS